VPDDPVLIVEDTPVNLKLVRFLLTREGYDVRAAGSAEEALETLKNFRPRIVLTDIQLPGIDGLELTRRLKSDPATSHLVVIALTAYAMKSDEKKAFDSGCDGFITKPIDTRTFPKLIQQYLGQIDKTPSKSDAEAQQEDPENPQEMLLREIRESFTTDGIEQVQQLINAQDTGFDSAAAKVTAHRWKGAAAQVGYLEISQKARELEDVLQQNGPDLVDRRRGLLADLSRLFGDARTAQQVR
jgi:two-component system cell cycle response regulator DivK